MSTTVLYTAVPTAGSFSVTAASVQDSTKSASANVTIPSVQVNVSVGVSPTSVTIQPNGTQQFTATVTGAANNSVTWAATGGTISSAGLYTASATTGSFT